MKPLRVIVAVGVLLALVAQAQEIDPPEYELLGIGSVDTARGKFWSVAVGVQPPLSEAGARDLFCDVALREVEAEWGHWIITAAPTAIEPTWGLRASRLASYEWGGLSPGPRAFLLASDPVNLRLRDIETPFDHTTDC